MREDETRKSHWAISSATARLMRDPSGVAAVEYGILVAGIGLALFGATQGFSYGNSLIWNLVLNGVNSAIGIGATP
jgi:Flp pilus assembly pilin Flp